MAQIVELVKCPECGFRKVADEDCTFCPLLEGDDDGDA